MLSKLLDLVGVQIIGTKTWFKGLPFFINEKERERERERENKFCN